MAKIEWTSELEIGISVIDNQHHRIVDYINQLYGIKGYDNREVVLLVINNLVDYTYSHFAFEETLLEEVGYPALDIHKVTHQAFCDKLDQLHKDFIAGNDVAQTLSDFLTVWLLEHINHDDVSYSALVKEKLPIVESKDNGHWIKNTIKRFFN